MQIATTPIDRRHVCSRCGARYAREQWRALRLVERIAAGDVRRSLQNWPETLCIEVRRCGGCGHAIAAKGESDTR